MRFEMRWNRQGRHAWLALLSAVAVLVGVVAAVPGGLANPEQALAQDRVLGGQLYSTGEVSEVTILGGTAGIVSTLWLVSPEEIRIGTNREVGKVAQIGPYPSGEELIFAIRYNNVEFQTGPGERNPDGIVHNAVVYGEEFTTVGFEDLVGGGDRDYDDNNWKFTNVAPEPPALSIDAGPDQVVPEGSTVTLQATTSVPVDGIQWSLVSSSGSPIAPLGLDTVSPTFQVYDDGQYVFRASGTRGELVATDDVRVDVTNVAPAVGAQAAPTTDDGLIMVSASVTDAGILDTHTASIDWGDGTAATSVAASAQGAGWATVAGAHAYQAPGTYTITITVEDDDGAATTTSVELVEVGGAGVPQPQAGVALWGDSSSDTRPLWLSGSGHQVFGLAHSNRDLRINGSNHAFVGDVEYVRRLDNKSNSTIFSTDPVAVAVADRPVVFPIERYQPGGEAAVAAGDQFFDMSAECGTKNNAKWKPRDVLASGLYWVPCEVDITGASFAAGPITIASASEISVSGGGKDFLAPFVDSALFISDSTSNRAIAIAGGSGTFSGFVSANQGDITIAGSGHAFDCGVLGETVKISGSGHLFDAGRCGLADTAGSLSDGVDVAAPPLIVPDLQAAASAPESALPAEAFDVAVTTTNDGSTIVVPGLVALSNGSSDIATIDSATYSLEIFDAADGWVTLATSSNGTATISGADAGNTDVSYPADGVLVGTQIPAGSAGVWAVTGTVELDAGQVDRVLDPARTLAVRSRVEITTAGNVLAVRQTTRFGGNVLDALIAAGGDIDDVEALLISNTSGSHTEAVGTLEPGDSVVSNFAHSTEAPGVRAADESDADYIARLQSMNSTAVAGVGSATGSSAVGTVYTSGQPVVTSIDVPVLRLSAAGTSARPDTDAVWVVAIENTGDATASSIGLVVTADGSTLAVPAIADLEPNSNGEIEIVVPVPAGLDSAALEAVLTWEDDAGNVYGSLSTTAEAVEIQPADLELLKLGFMSETELDTITYVVSVKNSGDADALSGVELVDEIDSNGALVSGSVMTTVGTVTSGNGVGDSAVGVDIGDLGPNQTAIVSFDVDVADRAAEVTEISNQAVVSSNELPDVLSDDTSLPGPADVTVIEVDGADPNTDPDLIGVGDVDGPAATDFLPESSSIIVGPETITASITTTDGALVTAWETKLFPAGSDPADGEVIASGTGEPSTLGEIDPTMLRNGAYTILFTASDDQGRTRISESNVIVDGYLKLGRFTMTYLDAEVNVGNLPLQVFRTYDTLDRPESGDFGFGWNLSFGNFRVDTNRVLGQGPWTSEGCGAGLVFQDICFASDPANTVTVVWPDGDTESFDFTPAGNTFFPIQATVAYLPRQGVTSTLAPVGNTTVSLSGLDGHLHAGGFGAGPIYNPTQFLLTDRFDTTYLLDVDEGLIAATDRNGNSVQVTDDGIVSSLGPSIDFTRDADGRITTATTPDGAQVTYAYDSAGDLETVVDANGATSAYSYGEVDTAAAHYLQEIDEPGAGPNRVLAYDDDGRLTSVTDAEGNTTAVDVDVDARTEIVTSPDGALTTISSFDERGNALSVNEVYDGASHVSTFVYDEYDQAVSRTDANGTTWAGSYDDARNLLSFSDGNGDSSSFAYDEFGFPTSVTDGNGDQTQFTYDTSGNLVTIVDARGNTQTFTYDGDGNQLTRTDQIGRSWSWAYTPEGRVSSATDPRGNATSYAYGGQGRLSSMTAADGGVTGYVYDDVGNLTRVTDPLGRATNYVYDGRDRLTSMTDPSGAVTAYSYDDNDRLVSMTDPTSRTWTYTYAFDRLATETAPDGGVTTYGYDGAGRVDTITDPLNRTTRYVYDAAGRRTQTVRPIGDGATATSTVTLDGNGRAIVRTNAEGEATNYVFDPVGRMTAMTDPIGRTTSYSFDAAGNRTAMTNGEGETSTWVFNPANELITATNAESESTSYTYDQAGNLASVSDPLDRVTTYGYDEVNRQDSVTLPSGDSGTTVFNTAGEVVTSTSPAGYSTSFTYDPRGLMATAADALGNTVTNTYDAAGRRTTVTDARGNDSTYGYDPVGRVETETDPLGGTIAFGYDLAGQRVSVTDANDATRTFGFDDGGRMISATDALDRITTYGFDDVGRRTSMVDARGITVSSVFDNAGQLTQRTSPDETQTFVYDDAGRRTGFTDATGNTTMVFDDAGRLTEVVAPAGTVTYGYNPAGERTSMSQPDGTLSYAYDANGFMSALTDWRTDSVAYVNDADGRMLTMERSNGVDTTYGYDTAGRLDAIAHDGPTGVIDSFDYTLDANGNRTAVTNTDGTETYVLDALNRLTSASYTDGSSETFGYDPQGNRTSATDRDGNATTYVVDAAGQLVSDSDGTGYVYDNAGNLISTSLGDAYTWDAHGRLVETSVGGVTESYGYDADNVRTEVGADAQLWDRTGLPTLIGDGTDTFVHGPGGVLRSGGDWLLTDAVGSVRNTTSDTGAVTDTSGFTVFGEPINEAGTFGFAGEQLDSTGLVHLRARQLDPTLGRLLSVDPVQPGAPGSSGWGLYAYAGSNPTSWSDPSGEVVLTGYALLNNREPTLAAVVGDLGLVLSTVLYTMGLCLAGYADCGPSYNFDFPNYDSGLSGSSTSSAAVVAPVPIQAGNFEDLVRQLQQELSTLSKATVKSIAATCVAQMVASSFADFEGICTGDRDPVYIVGAADLPGVSRHIGTNLITRPFNASLTTRTSTNDRRWLRSQAECSTSSSELFCDEFPFASTNEGGHGNYPARVSLQVIRRNENNAEGGILNGFYRRCGLVRNGERFFVASSNSPALPWALSLPTIYFGPSGCIRPGFG